MLTGKLYQAEMLLIAYSGLTRGEIWREAWMEYRQLNSCFSFQYVVAMIVCVCMFCEISSRTLEDT